MKENYLFYRAESNKYEEYSTLFGGLPNSSEPDYQKIIHIGTSIPRYISTPDGKYIEVNIELSPLTQLSEILFQIDGDTIMRVFSRPYISHIPEIKEEVTTQSNKVIELLPRDSYKPLKKSIRN